MKDRKLNAIPPRQLEHADDRTARHVRMCVELADLAMQLARAAAAKALAAQAEPEPAPTAAPPSEPRVEPPSQPAPAPQTLRNAGKSPTCKSIDPALLFVRLAAVVKYCITLEIRLTSGAVPAAARAPATPSHTDPRRAPLRETFRYVTTNQGDQAALLREINTRLDQQLAADPAQTITLPAIFTTICEDLALEPDFATLPDKYLDLLTDDTPDPHANSPP